MKLFQNPIWLLGISFLISCKEEYHPDIKNSEQSVLVVEGILNSGAGPTTIKLSRTIKLYDTVKVQPETGAQLVVEGKNGLAVSLVDSGNGNYSTTQLTLNPAETYRLTITTRNGEQYASDYVAVRKNPPIDSVSWRRNEEGVTIFVNTHNPENNTRYYRWEFDETWAIRSVYPFAPLSGLIEDDGILEPLGPGESYYNCWKQNNSSNLVLGNTTQLSADIVFEKPLIAIPDGNDRLSERYTVLVRQYALDKEGYEFYQLMRKNTESLGTIFDAQPTEITGNVHALSDPDALVIGYIMASSIDTTRLWIKNAEVPRWKPWADCTQTIKVNKRLENVATFKGDYLPFGIDPNDNVYLARRECVSCRTRGGKTKRPDYW